MQLPHSLKKRAGLEPINMKNWDFKVLLSNGSTCTATTWGGGGGWSSTTKGTSGTSTTRGGAGSEGGDVTYLKNVVMKLLQTTGDQHEAMLPVLSTLLEMDQCEVALCREGIEKVKALEDGTAAINDAYAAVEGVTSVDLGGAVQFECRFTHTA
jgi:hypothetical protein